jgi:hypothetical protein
MATTRSSLNNRISFSCEVASDELCDVLVSRKRLIGSHVLVAVGMFPHTEFHRDAIEPFSWRFADTFLNSTHARLGPAFGVFRLGALLVGTGNLPLFDEFEQYGVTVDNSRLDHDRTSFSLVRYGKCRSGDGDFIRPVRLKHGADDLAFKKPASDWDPVGDRT